LQISACLEDFVGSIAWVMFAFRLLAIVLLLVEQVQRGNRPDYTNFIIFMIGAYILRLQELH